MEQNFNNSISKPIQVSEVDPKEPQSDKIVIVDGGNSTNKNSSQIVVRGDEYEYKEVDEGLKGEKGVIKHFMNGKAKIAVKDAFPKIIHLNA